MTTNQDQTIYVTENKQEFVPEVGRECEIFDPYGNAAKVELLAIKGGKAVVWNDAVGFAETTELEWLRPLKTEAEIKREAEIQKIDRAYSCACGYALISSECMSESLYKQGVRVVDEKLIEEAAKDKGYIKPRELTSRDVETAVKGYLNGPTTLSNYHLSFAFARGAEWAEKHIKGEE